MTGTALTHDVLSFLPEAMPSCAGRCAPVVRRCDIRGRHAGVCTFDSAAPVFENCKARATLSASVIQASPGADVWLARSLTAEM